jgi:hypothetical protein
MNGTWSISLGIGSHVVVVTSNPHIYSDDALSWVILVTTTTYIVWTTAKILPPDENDQQWFSAWPSNNVTVA